uniref:Protein kinase domain-containing protein n=1 Tax=Chromera velia CCMP2878 TaxID=1169474 RepID=A0A0G4HTC8_9ALVE|eukprot:Cvel_8456.t1-p1 / transcript=Cvel_8456.t1 / gene=Cvel_8456 / organism=Chromera_velia_CCMP2878 / gene_product=Protein NLRC3, putative / transcript_product=Protein NLRC3, putative / location=Cvel_scaffold467:26495-38464(-) / protein_length=1303 / sequence_SO=supercontig / SO=protein_coding / is_pseudo=false
MKNPGASEKEKEKDKSDWISIVDLYTGPKRGADGEGYKSISSSSAFKKTVLTFLQRKGKTLLDCWKAAGRPFVVNQDEFSSLISRAFKRKDTLRNANVNGLPSRTIQGVVKAGGVVTTQRKTTASPPRHSSTEQEEKQFIAQFWRWWSVNGKADLLSLLGGCILLLPDDVATRLFLLHDVFASVQPLPETDQRPSSSQQQTAEQQMAAQQLGHMKGNNMGLADALQRDSQSPVISMTQPAVFSCAELYILLDRSLRGFAKLADLHEEMSMTPKEVEVLCESLLGTSIDGGETNVTGGGHAKATNGPESASVSATGSPQPKSPRSEKRSASVRSETKRGTDGEAEGGASDRESFLDASIELEKLAFNILPLFTNLGSLIQQKSQVSQLLSFVSVSRDEGSPNLSIGSLFLGRYRIIGKARAPSAQNRRLILRVMDEIACPGEAPSSLSQSGTGVGGVPLTGNGEWRGPEYSLHLLMHADCDPPSELRMFMREAILLSTLRHKSLVRVHGFGQMPGGAFQITDVLKGCTLAEFLQQLESSAIGIPELDILDLLTGVLVCLEEIHQKGVVHTALSPSSIFLKDGSLKTPIVTSLERAAWDPQTILGHPAPVISEIAETTDSRDPRYISPEQSAGDVSLPSPVWDIYSVCCIAFECVCLEAPFDGSSLWRPLAPEPPPDLRTPPESDPTEDVSGSPAASPSGKDGDKGEGGKEGEEKEKDKEEKKEADAKKAEDSRGGSGEDPGAETATQKDKKEVAGNKALREVRRALRRMHPTGKRALFGVPLWLRQMVQYLDSQDSAAVRGEGEGDGEGGECGKANCEWNDFEKTQKELLEQQMPDGMASASSAVLLEGPSSIASQGGGVNDSAGVPGQGADASASRSQREDESSKRLAEKLEQLRAIRQEQIALMPPDVRVFLTSDDLVDIIERGLSKRAHERFQSASEMRAVLENLFQQLMAIPLCMQECLPHLKYDMKKNGAGDMQARKKETLDLTNEHKTSFTSRYLAKFAKALLVDNLHITGGALPLARIRNKRNVSLDLTGRRLASHDVLVLSNLLYSSRHISNLVLESNFIAHDSEARMKENRYMYELSGVRSKNSFGGKGGAVICEALGKCPGMRTLKLALCDLMEQGGMALARSMKNMKELMELDISSCYIGDRGTVDIAGSLNSSPKLNSVNLFANSIENLGGSALMIALQNNFQLKSLSLGHNDIERPFMEVIDRSVSFNNMFLANKLHNMKFGVFGPNLMCESLKKLAESDFFISKRLIAKLKSPGDALEEQAAKILLSPAGDSLNFDNVSKGMHDMAGEAH